MKKMLVGAGLWFSLAGNVYAQQNGKPTYPASERIGTGRHQISRTLPNRNRVVLDFNDWNDLRAHRNVDSLLRLFVQDFRAFRDTVGVRVDSRRADYRVELDGRRTLTLQTQPATVEEYVFRSEEETVQVKTVQDTLLIRRNLSAGKEHFLTVYLFVNRLEEVEAIAARGLNAEIERGWQLAQEYPKRALFRTGTRSRISLDSTDQRRAVWTGRWPSSYFFLSVSAGAGLTRSQFYNTLNYDFGYSPGNGKTGFLFGFQMYHTFDRFPDGSPHLTLEPFVHVGLALFPKGTTKSGNVFERNGQLTIGYRGGTKTGFFEPHTFRFAASISPLKWVRVEPELYSNFSRNLVYPGLRVNVGF